MHLRIGIRPLIHLSNNPLSLIGVILVILANTMAMTSRERMPEYATLKTMGFGNRYLWMLIAGESVFISGLGGGFGIVISYPAAAVFSAKMGTLLPVFHIQTKTILLCMLVSGVGGTVGGASRRARSRSLGACSYSGRT